MDVVQRQNVCYSSGMIPYGTIAIQITLHSHVCCPGIAVQYQMMFRLLYVLQHLGIAEQILLSYLHDLQGISGTLNFQIAFMSHLLVFHCSISLWHHDYIQWAQIMSQGLFITTASAHISHNFHLHGVRFSGISALQVVSVPQTLGTFGCPNLFCG